ncbi:sensor histidine kinase [Aliterella atlantica]|uniref:histidine kinase n=1 Tax=Aliterella atlantica CENA595 TaxID=1618023 RepID=A0A0D8ZVI3_9CYAN|nr:HAMP domain-containing sensor histidine kinase [Aliterella atlantica]KJH72778.1 ATPase [Aliterella atlantica CENA595]
MKKIDRIWQKIDPFSLRVRLTVGIAAVSAVGVGSIALWTTWQMQQILVNSHKQNIELIADRLPGDIKLYSDMFSTETSLRKAIANLTTNKTVIWVKRPDGTINDKSVVPLDSAAINLISQMQSPLSTQVYEIGDRYFVVSGKVLQVKAEKLGLLFVAQDISYEQTMFLALVRSLAIVSLLALVIITVAIAWYIQKSLQPLRQISQLAGTISANDLAQARLNLERAPTEVQELVHTCNMMLDRLSQSWEQQRQFVGNVSHELRTPLTIVRGYLQSVLKRENNLTPPQREALTTAASEAESTIRLLQDLLDLARADTGYLHMHLELLLLNDLVGEVAAMAQQYSNREITLETSNSKIVVKADRHRLKQVILNLIDNAVKYSDLHSAIAIKLDTSDQRAIIHVCDRGLGIPLQHQQRIFERFYRVDEARNRATGGCGLGLSIVKTLVDGMGGNVTVRSKLGEGSIFTVTLPSAA